MEELQMKKKTEKDLFDEEPTNPEDYCDFGKDKKTTIQISLATRKELNQLKFNSQFDVRGNLSYDQIISFLIFNNAKYMGYVSGRTSTAIKLMIDERRYYVQQETLKSKKSQHF
jgi:hypothetical protein